MRKCTVCQHPEIAKINEALATGGSYRGLARQFNLSRSAVDRHAKNHLPAALVKAREASEVANADGLLDQVCSLRDRALGILSDAETAKDLRTALVAVREVRGCVELLAKMLLEAERLRLAGGERDSERREDLEGMSNDELERRLRLCRGEEGGGENHD